MRLIYVEVEAQPLRERLHSRVAKHVAALADHDGYFLQLHLKAVEEFLRSFVRIQIHVGKGMAIPGEELANLQRARRVP